MQLKLQTGIHCIDTRAVSQIKCADMCNQLPSYECIRVMGGTGIPYKGGKTDIYTYNHGGI